MITSMSSAVRAMFGCSGLLCILAAGYGQTALRGPSLEGIAGGKTRVIDLSYAISDKMVPWPGDAKALEAKTNATVEKNGYSTRSFWMLEHYGRHMDAPAHFLPATMTLDQLAVEKFFGRAVVLDVTKEAALDPDYQLSIKKIAAF